MAVTRQQVLTASNTYNGSTTYSSLNIPIGTAPQANSLLIAAWTVDKNAGTFTVPTGWTTLLSRGGASVSLLIAYKIATGAETGATASWTSPMLGAAGYVAEYRGVDTTTPLGPNALESVYSDTARTSIAFAPSASTAAGIAVAIIAIDTDTGTGFQPAATGYSQAAKVGPGDSSGAPGLVLDEHTVSASGATTAPTFSWTTSDQVQGALLQIREAGTSAFSGTTALSGTGVLSVPGAVLAFSGAAALTGPGALTVSRTTITRRQLFSATNAYNGSTTYTSLAIPISSAPAVNGLLIAAWVIDKASGSFATPSGWTAVLSRAGNSVSTYIAYKIATGAETSVSLTWTTASLGAIGNVVEYTGVDTVTPLGPNDVSTFADSAAVTSLGFSPAAPTADGLALAIIGIDTIATSGGFNIAATGYTLVSSATFSINSGSPGLALSEKRTTSGTANTPTFTWTDSDQVNGALLQLNQAAPPSVFSGTAALAGTGALTATGFQTLTAPTSLGGPGILAVTGAAALTGSTAGYIEMWTGTAWVPKPIKMWTGTDWVIKPLKVWTGTAWVAVTAP